MEENPNIVSYIIKEKDILNKTEKIAGADVSYYKNKAIAGVVVLEFPHLKIIEKKSFIYPVGFPYISGLLTFWEEPALLGALKRIRNKPDIILLDDQGTAHPRRMGIATHMGLFLNKPAIGCAKSRLSGNYSALGEKRGNYSLLKEKEEVIGQW